MTSPIPSRGAPTRDNPPLMKAMLEALEPFFETTGPHCDAAYAAYQAAALLPVEAANGSGSYEDLKVVYWTLHAALQEVTAMCPTADPGPAKNEMGHWNDEGNADDIAYACRDEALWRVKEVADHALFQGRVLADHEPAASPPLAEGQDGKGG